MSRNSVADVLKRGKSFLKSAGIETWELDAELLLMECAGLTRVRLLTEPGDIVDAGAEEIYRDYIGQRAERKPVQYILNRCEFMSLDFYVDENVLIPRPDTEALVENSIDIIKKHGYKNILEIGTGSGCISVSLAYYLKDVEITAYDISMRALDIARRNARKNGAADKINFVRWDCFESLSPPGGIYDMIVSNPPYICTDVIETLGDNVKKFEPLTALDGGSDGLRFYRAIADGAKNVLRPGGAIACEIGFDQAGDVKKLFKNNNFEKIEIIKDLSGQDRVIIVGNEKIITCAKLFQERPSFRSFSKVKHK